MTQYFRRSRTGCLTCKSARIKCNEEKPFCGNCAERGLKCQGYSKRLKWIVQEVNACRPEALSHEGTTLLETHLVQQNPPHVTKGTRCLQKDGLTALPMADMLLNTQPDFVSTNDIALFDYWAKSLFQVSFPNPSQYSDYQQSTRSMALAKDSLLIWPLLASASVHLAMAGRIPEKEMLWRKQKAIHTVKHALACVSQKQSHIHSDRSAMRRSVSSMETMNMLVCASLHIIGTELVHGSDMDTILPLTRGAAYLVKERWASNPSSKDPFDIVVRQDIKLLGWHNLILCVPYPREPVLETQYWYHLFEEHAKEVSAVEPDAVFGFAAHITILTGECGGLVGSWYRQQITPEEFVERRGRLMQQISVACLNLPPPRLPSDQRNGDVYNTSIYAALSHALASQIYLARATEFQSNSPAIGFLVGQLEEAVQSVHLASPVVTIMLWPMWVLGCESEPASQRRWSVVSRLQEMLKKNGIMNIKTCLETLSDKIWSLQKDDSAKDHKWQYYGQSAWVRACFEERIQPVLV
ncbi:fungal-specific transcription factor domain-containing protein [Stachybotrys elegans]|uniref:Fungal-specific transcription factor domain-containing protein n=1 Tax=Stachybotrys elegans TaxID=80388 RepID=A0A8K0T1C0_9HYPO|nr:fungal-specific transcription factor domain-containing protein [Stachybotrys elegans]